MRDISPEEFDDLLIEVVSEATTEQLVKVPGLYEALAEAFGPDVHDRWLNRLEDERAERERWS